MVWFVFTTIHSLNSVVKLSALLQSHVLYYSIPYCATPYSSIQYHTILYCTILLCTYYREAYRNGTLTTEGVRRVLKLDPNKMGKIADFFVREIAEAVPRVPANFQDKITISGNGTGNLILFYFYISVFIKSFSLPPPRLVLIFIYLDLYIIFPSHIFTVL